MELWAGQAVWRKPQQKKMPVNLSIRVEGGAPIIFAPNDFRFICVPMWWLLPFPTSLQLPFYLFA